MINTLLRRIFDARGKQRLEAQLKFAKLKSDAKRNAFRTTGTDDELLKAVQAAILEKALTEAEVAALVDSLEENGAQHIFLFDLTDAGRKVLTPAAFVEAFTAAPAKPTEAFYAQYPASKRTVYALRDPNVITVKQVFTTEYWERNQEASKETDDRRTLVYDRHQRRSINLLRIDLDSGRVEVRVDQVQSKDDRKIAGKLLNDFRNDLLKLIDFEKHFSPVDVAKAFPRIIGARDETFMSVDEAFDASASMRFANMRGDTRGQDIRDYPPYAKAVAQQSIARRTVRVHWLIGNGEERRKIYSIVSSLEVNGANGDLVDYAKAYVPGKVSGSDLAHVIARIRHFAS